MPSLLAIPACPLIRARCRDMATHEENAIEFGKNESYSNITKRNLNTKSHRPFGTINFFQQTDYVLNVRNIVCLPSVKTPALWHHREDTL